MFDAWRISWTVLPSTPFDAFSASRAAAGIVFLDPRAVGFEQLAVGFVGAQRLLARQQVIAGEAVLDLHHVADGAELLDALKQNDFHVGAPYFTM